MEEIAHLLNTCRRELQTKPKNGQVELEETPQTWGYSWGGQGGSGPS